MFGVYVENNVFLMAEALQGAKKLYKKKNK